MSDEAAFLDALKANPADDTARLVYADWLDEHDQPQKAEYLRAVVACAAANGTVPDSLIDLAEQLQLDWRLATGTRFALVLESFETGRKIEAIKVVREMTGMGLAEAKKFVESAPSGFLFRMTPEAADSVTRYFGPGRLCVSPEVTTVVSREPTATTFAVYAELICSEWDADRLPTGALDEFRAFLAKGGSTQHITQNDVDATSVAAKLGTDFSYARAQIEIARWRAILPANSTENEWTIIVYPSLQLRTS